MSFRDAFRVLACLCGLVLALFLSGFIVFVSRSYPAASYFAIVPVVLGFLGFRFSGTARAPARPLRLTVAVGMVLLTGMLSGLGWPPARSDGGRWLVIVGDMLLLVSAAVIARRRPRLATWLLLAPATYAMFRLPLLVMRFRAVSGSLSLSPAVALANLIAGSACVAGLVALWHSWSIPATEGNVDAGIDARVMTMHTQARGTG